MLHFWHQVFMKCFKIITFWRHFSKNFIALTFSVRPQWPHSCRWVSCTEAWIPDLMSIFSIFFLYSSRKRRIGEGGFSGVAAGAADKLTCQCVPEVARVVLLNPQLQWVFVPPLPGQGDQCHGRGENPTTFYVFFPFHRDHRWIHPRRQTPTTPGGYLSSIQGRNIYLYFSLSLSCSCRV